LAALRRRPEFPGSWGFASPIDMAKATDDDVRKETLAANAAERITRPALDGLDADRRRADGRPRRPD
jgi:hypothetical protein